VNRIVVNKREFNCSVAETYAAVIGCPELLLEYIRKHDLGKASNKNFNTSRILRVMPKIKVC
jgi:hypothetical protein